MWNCRPSLVLILFISVLLPCADGADEYTFIERDVEFSDGPVLLKGTLFMPDSDRESPSVVLLGGAERGPRTPYKARIAEHFARNGFAALIYDSPGTGQSKGNAILQTRKDRACEAHAATSFLRKQDGIRPEQVGIWGLSEGAGIALLAAAMFEETAFVIAVSGGVGVTALEQTGHRVEIMGLEQGLPQDEIQKGLVFREILFSLLVGKDIVEWRMIRMKIKQWPEEPWNDLVDLVKRCREPLTVEEKGKVLKSLGKVVDTWKSEPWFKLVVVDPKKFEQFFSFDPVLFFQFLEKGHFAAGDWNYSHREFETYSKIKCPLLAIWGAYDRFVPPYRSMIGLEDAMRSSKNKDLTLKVIPNASHIFTVPGDMIEFAEGYPHLMTDWLRERFGK